LQALLKIVKHCHESLPQMVTGSLLGMTTKGNDGEGILEVTHAFPFPDSGKGRNNSNAADREDGENASTNDNADTSGLEGHEYQLEMMRMLREVNVDNNCVGWYQSMYLGIYSTSNLLENQWSYQTDLSPNAVVILYDPMQTSNGNMVLKCYRLTEECIRIKASGENVFIDPKNIFEPIPVKLTNPGLVHALLSDMVKNQSQIAAGSDGAKMAAAAAATTTTKGLYNVGDDISFDRLDLSTSPYLEKHLEFLCGWVDELSNEQQKFQYYSRQLSRQAGGGEQGGKDHHNRNKRQQQHQHTSNPEAWMSSDAPKRMESLLVSNQIRSYVDQMDQFSSAGLSKLYLTGSLHQEEAPMSMSLANKTSSTTMPAPAGTK
jgi:translation initiation factor 3 subunit H